MRRDGDLERGNLIDVLDRVLDKGIIIDGWGRVASAAIGFADHASTIATLIIRPSMWFGTTAWRSDAVLMLNRIPKPEESAHSTTATHRDVVYARAITSRAESMSAPRATLPKDQRFRSGPAASDSATTPAPPAANKTATSLSDARSPSFANSTSCAKTVASTMLIIAIISEMFRRTGWERT